MLPGRRYVVFPSSAALFLRFGPPSWGSNPRSRGSCSWASRRAASAHAPGRPGRRRPAPLPHRAATPAACANLIAGGGAPPLRLHHTHRDTRGRRSDRFWSATSGCGGAGARPRPRVPFAGGAVKRGPRGRGSEPEGRGPGWQRARIMITDVACRHHGDGTAACRASRPGTPASGATAARGGVRGAPPARAGSRCSPAGPLKDLGRDPWRIQGATATRRSGRVDRPLSGTARGGTRCMARPLRDLSGRTGRGTPAGRRRRSCWAWPATGP